jgi:hypothetical protein
MIIGYPVEYPDTMASARFRTAIPARELRALGYRVEIGIGNISVVPKHAIPMEGLRAIAEQSILVFDVSDDHLDTKEGDYYREAFALADYITCTTPWLKGRIGELGYQATVITDPLEFPRREPRIGTNRFLWYGHKSNIRPILELAPYIPGEMRFVSDAKIDGVIPFSLEAMQEGLDWCDAVIIPIKQQGAPRWEAKSPNRMTEAINAGRYVIANPLPSYEGYGMWTGSILEGVKWFVRQQDKALQAVKQAQPMVTEKHDPRVIGLAWANLFDSIWAAGKKSGRGSSTAISQIASGASPRM